MYERKQYHPPTPTTDIIIEYERAGKEGIILIQRKNPPLGLAIPGGFAEYGISLADNAIKEAKEETNLDVVITEPDRPFLVKSGPDRDPRGHMISVTYVARGYGDLKAGDDAARAFHYTIPEVQALIDNKKLVFDHADILREYIKEYHRR